MPVNPDEILIFKLRGITTGKKARLQEAAAAPVSAPAQAQAPEQVRAAEEVQVTKPEPKAPVLTAKKQVPAKKAKPSPAPRPLEAAAPKRNEVEAPKVEPMKTEEEMMTPQEKKNMELEKLEEIANEQYGPVGTAVQPTKREASNIFSIFAGILFIANAGLFGYFIYPQALFIIGYIAKTGLASFALSFNYDYGVALINLILLALAAICGLLLVARVKQSHFISGIVGASLVLCVTFEYLNSSTSYLLIVSVTSFICIIALAYSRMSAVVFTEREETPQEITWPRIETF